MVHSIEVYYSGLLSNHNGFMRFLFSLLSNFMFAHCLLHCLLIVNVRSETKYSSPRKQWNSYDMHLQYFNINSQRFNSRLRSWQSASRLFSLFKYHCSSQSSYFLEGTWKSSQTMQVVIRGEMRGRFLINAVWSVYLNFFKNWHHFKFIAK